MSVDLSVTELAITDKQRKRQKKQLAQLDLIY